MRQSRLYCEWEPRVRDYRQSGLSVANWCALNGLSVHKLRYWVIQVNKVSVSGESSLAKTGDQNCDYSWAAVKIVDNNRNSNIAICIGSARIEVSSGFDKSLLSDVLQVVTRSC